MELGNFYELIENHPDLEGLHINNENGEVAIRQRSTGRTTVLGVDELIAMDAEREHELVEVLLGRREASVLNHVTRVVGYFSRVENWNVSKLGELRDRQKGRYTLEPKQTPKIETTTCTS